MCDEVVGFRQKGSQAHVPIGVSASAISKTFGPIKGGIGGEVTPNKHNLPERQCPQKVLAFSPIGPKFVRRMLPLGGCELEPSS